jgi:hypothetical protein
MTLHLTHKLTQNDNGGNLYFSPEFVTDSQSPLALGEPHDIITIPHRAVVVAPAGSLELPETLTVRDPRLDDHTPR